MLLNFGKCKCMHIEHGNMDEEYKMGDAVLDRTTQEKDLGAYFEKQLFSHGWATHIGGPLTWVDVTIKELFQSHRQWGRNVEKPLCAFS